MAVGARAGQKVFSLQTVLAREEEPKKGVARYAGFSRCMVALAWRPISERSSRCGGPLKVIAQSDDEGSTVRAAFRNTHHEPSLATSSTDATWSLNISSVTSASLFTTK